jgi:hypothetical protein
LLSNATHKLIPPPLMNPNTNIKMSGNASVNTTAEGLRRIDRKLALEMASMAFN